jgi:DNA polymerase-3 subunit epsilon
MLPNKLVFVDVETTGLQAKNNRIIEIGIIRVENNMIVNEIRSFINPKRPIPKEITMMTGITNEDVRYAPTFQELKEAIFAIMQGCTFVAHNAPFDYDFLKYAFLRENMAFFSQKLCTVSLSRHLFPHWRRHNLDTAIKECNIPYRNRHRAYDDAHVLFLYYQHLLETIPTNKLTQTIKKIVTEEKAQTPKQERLIPHLR